MAGVTAPGAVAMAGRCPACGQGHLFKGYLEVADRCDVCGLDLAFADSGDGPAFFVMSIVGILATLLVIILIYGIGLPAGAALLLAFIFTMGGALAILRPAKGLLIGLQYRNNAAEGRTR